ncbi:transmembrane protein 199-like [Ptychodera flava]|uniref:transmembrane protein 199-like n=1 Tax=Ptychodera flava TaxID=63121 RepID=UPI003969F879
MEELLAVEGFPVNDVIVRVSQSHNPLKQANMAAVHVTLSERIKRVIQTLLTDSDLPDKLRLDLEKYCGSEKDPSESIPFQVVRKCHQQLTKDGTSSLYLHELLEGSEVYFPPLPKPKRNPELVARLERLKAEQQNREYNRMTKAINVKNLQKTSFAEFGAEVRSVKRQVMTVMNSFLTVIGAFVFGYMAASFSHQPVALCVMVGLVLSSIVGLADLYFLAKTTL